MGMPSEFIDINFFILDCCHFVTLKYRKDSHNQTSLQHLGLMSNVQCLGATEETTNTNHVHGPRVYLDMMIICFNATQLVILKYKRVRSINA